MKKSFEMIVLTAAAGSMSSSAFATSSVYATTFPDGNATLETIDPATGPSSQK